MYKSILLLVILSSLLCSCRNKEFCSPYIGIYGTYAGYENGRLPAARTDYSGPFCQKYPNGVPAFEGQYVNGIPTGLWKIRYPNGLLDTLMGYLPEGKFYQIEYYPDGTAKSRKTGKYIFKDNTYKTFDRETKNWNFDGSVSKASPSFIARTTGDAVMWCQMADFVDGYMVDGYADAVGNDLTIKVFLIPEGNIELDLSAVQAFVIKGNWDPEKREFHISETETFGSLKLKYLDSTIRNGSLWLTFQLPDMSKYSQFSVGLELK